MVSLQSFAFHYNLNILITIFVLLSFFCNAQPNAYTSFSIGSPTRNEIGTIIAPCPNGDFVSCGSNRLDDSTNYRILLVRFDSDQNVIFQRDYGCNDNAQGPSYNSFYKSLVCLNDGIFIAGYISDACNSAGKSVGYIHKLSSDGITYKEVMVFNGASQPYMSRIDCLTMLPNGGFIFAGNYMGSNPGTTLMVYDSSHSLSKQALYSSIASVINEVSLVSDDVAAFVGYNMAYTPFHAVICVFLINNLVQQFYHDYVNTMDAFYLSLAPIKGGGYMVTGYLKDSSNNFHHIIIKYGATLGILNVLIDTGVLSTFNKVKEMGNGNFVFVGCIHSGTLWQSWVLFTDNNGNLVNQYIASTFIETDLLDVYLADYTGAIRMVGQKYENSQRDFYFLFREGCGNLREFSKIDESTCVCAIGTINDGAGQCKILNNIATFKCTTITDCADAGENAECNTTKLCVCKENYDFDPTSNLCLGKNNGISPCITLDDCIDKTTLKTSCFNGKCSCELNYVWMEYSTSHSCFGHNNGLSSCTISDQCVDNFSGRASCANFKCVCISPYTEYIEERLRCTVPNTGATPCSDLNDCADNDSSRAECSQNMCRCKTPYSVYVSARKLCAVPNDNVSPCLNLNDCADNGVFADCVNGLCTCKYSYVWSSSERKCLGKSSGNVPCNTIADCIDNINSQCSVYCTCKANTGWLDTANKCLPFNDNTTPCLTLADCYDQGSRALCAGFCTCQNEYLYNPSNHYCRGKNDGTSKCIILPLCYDSNTIRANCTSQKCYCRPNYKWIESRKRCFGENANLGICATVEDCVDNSNNGLCTSGKCACAIDRKYDPVRQKCLPINDGHYDCFDVQDCSDNTYKAICNGKCNCVGDYIWSYPRQYCVGYNIGTTDCTDVTKDCADGSVLSAVCSANKKCECAQYHAWDNTVGLCLCAKGTYSPSANGREDCIPCNPGTFQINLGRSSCIPCPMSYYLPNPGSQSFADCTPCPAWSNSQTGAGRCSCYIGYYDTGDSTNYCKKCHPFCKKCSVSATDCAFCMSLSGIYYSNKKCLCNTDFGYYVRLGSDYTGDQCLACNKFCKRCFGSTNEECLECTQGFEHIALFGNTCTCISGYWLDQADPITPCKLCPIFCKTCSDSKTCTSCEDNDGLVLVNSLCHCVGSGYFLYYNEANPGPYKDECVKCHPLCLECDGPLPSQCSKCDEEIGSFLQGKSCICKFNSYYDISQKCCIPCDSLCNGCTGPGSSACLGCNTTLAYPVQKQSSLCTTDCSSLDGYYKDWNSCKLCHERCKNCYGPYFFQCTECTGRNYVIYNGNCINECPDHFVPINHICYECHKSCKTCTNISSNGCITCQSFLYLYKNQCIEKCPNGTYSSNDFTCTDCVLPCETCLSLDKCLTCAKKYYWIREENHCVTKDHCPKTMYADNKTGFCEPCHFTCLTCTGPYKYDCLLCNIEKGYIRNEGNYGECDLKMCADGFYVSINISNNTISCSKCDPSCKTCLNSGSENCTLCNQGYTPFPANTEGLYRCKSCSEINPGFTTNPDFKCVEICGDGKNMGQLECDDGNQINYDGCNNQCKIEDGFACNHSENNADICIDIKPPSATLEIKKGNLLVINFNELVTVLVDSQTLLSKYMEISIEGIKEDCAIIKNMAFDFPSKSNLTAIYLQINATCILHGTVETYVIKFTRPSYIQDLAGNILSTPILTAKTMRSVYISRTEKAVVEGTGTSFSASTMTTFGVAIGMSVMQSKKVGDFWAFINMVQLISYIPIIKLVVPINMQLFLSNYLGVSKASIPFNLLPNGFPNPINSLKIFSNSSLGNGLGTGSYETFSFIYNFGQELITWLTLFGFYLVLCFLDYILPPNSFSVLRRMKKDYEYNAVIRILLETNMNMVFCAFLNIWLANPNNWASKFSYAFACGGSFLAVGFLMKIFRLIETPRKLQKSKSFKETYGNIFENLKTRKGKLWTKYYYPFYLIRRMIYAIILITLIDYPYIQIALILFMNSIPMLFYLILIRPLKKTFSNIISIYNESVVIICYGTIGILNLGEFKSRTFMNVGWALVSFVILSLAACWFSMLPGATKELFNAIKGFFFKKKQENQSPEQNTIYQNTNLHQDSTNKLLKIQNENLPEIKQEQTAIELKQQIKTEFSEEDIPKPKHEKSVILPKRLSSH